MATATPLPLCTAALGISVSTILSCSSPASSERSALSVDSSHPTQELAPATIRGQDVGYFAGGCFWGVEHFLEKLPGVSKVESGYMGGHVHNPTYKQITTQSTGHYEAVRVFFDHTKTSYSDVAKRFFEIHDPTQVDGQGPDIGSSYRSAIFYATPQQRSDTDVLVGRLRTRGYEVTTAVLPATRFYAAKDFHQDYYARTGKAPYCHSPVDRFGTASQ